MEYLYTIIMGIVEGITEFLPISSTGHLILTNHLLGFEDMVGGKAFADSFEIIIQLGAILAIVAAYPKRFWSLVDYREKTGLSGVRGLTLLAIATIPASLLAWRTHHYIKEHLFSPKTVVCALAIGAIAILLVEYFLPPRKKEGVDSITWKEALIVGLFQCFSLWPGMSRSACTILGGMISGLERKTATEFSFFAAVPIMIIATGYELMKNYHSITRDHLAILALGFIVAFVFAWIAVKCFIGFLGRHTLKPFAWYRLILAGLIAGFLIWH